MPRFNNIEDVRKYIKNNPGKVKLKNGMTVAQLLDIEAKKLYDILTKHVALYYSHREPTAYQRTFGLMNSLRIERPKVEGGEISVRIYFDPEMSTHESLFGGDPGFTPVLINWGWEVKQGAHWGVEHFGQQEGWHFVEKAIREWQATNKLGFGVKVRVSAPNVDTEVIFSGEDISL